MPQDTPNPNKDVKERGTFAGHSEDPTLASYLSSAFLLLSVPAFIVFAYGGFWLGLYPYSGVLPAFAGLLVASITAAFALMHVFSSGR
ncbi:MAG: hypothetical protein ABEH90_09355 [Halolamina sp.]